MEALGREAEARPERSVHLPRLTVLGETKPSSRRRPRSRDRLGRGSLAQQTATARDGDREALRTALARLAPDYDPDTSADLAEQGGP